MVNCADLPKLECEVPKEGLTLDLVLQPKEQVGGESQYWPLFNADNPEERFGNMHFSIAQGGVLTLKITLDLSEVPGRELEFVRYHQNHKLDGIIALSPDFRHQFRARAKEVDGDYTKLVIKIKDKESIPDNFSFLWMCVDVETGMHFVSGDPEAVINPLP
ncbi:hypothetical protein MO867_04390 [Microbulbifer sp. OS29]|uniref:Uncharacterized protein n=1 Tax=Microbulbifer okhotskensis TaxID=2926617 RepID=A0A9X2EJU8_9GAMM|nr:hypothetical protein [Microbulbifer okhotskensis]MCO1333574.1 hypothetical protein [Microbulbifer okhotskensis]